MNWKVWKPWFGATGRANRTQYWTALVSMIALSWIVSAIGRALQMAAVPVLVDLLLAWVWICLFTRRFHDLGHSGWWQLVLLVVAFCAAGASELAMISPQGSENLALVVLMVIGLLLYVGGIIGLGVMPSQPGSNRFDAPVEGEPAAA